ncbi:MAG: hypothetical protein JWN44_1518 [Myxococcales bacterium]|nr:hypothetical protein [Myxococcales bacterium]
MRRGIVIALVLFSGGVAAAVTKDPVPPTAGQGDVRGRRHPLRPIDFAWRQMDMDRQNVGTPGRLNALRQEQQESLIGWSPAPLSGGSR